MLDIQRLITTVVIAALILGLRNRLKNHSWQAEGCGTLGYEYPADLPHQHDGRRMGARGTVAAGDRDPAWSPATPPAPAHLERHLLRLAHRLRPALCAQIPAAYADRLSLFSPVAAFWHLA